VYSLGRNNPPRIVLHLESRASKIYDVTNRGTVYVKWRILEFAHLVSSAVKCRGLPQQEYLLGKPLSSGLRFAKFHAQVARNTCGQVNPVAIRSQIHTSVAHLSAECGIIPKSSPRHFTSRITLLVIVSYIFAARLLEYKIPTPRIV
jgi:hypothetical protein